MVASASPTATRLAAAFTSASLDATLDSTLSEKSLPYTALAFVRLSLTYCATGTSSWASTRVMPALARSRYLAMPARLPAGTITVRRFLAKVWGASARPSLTAASFFASSAEANTSAGAPCSSCVRRVELPAKFSFTSVPGCSSSKLAFSSPKASVSEEAAKTVKADSSPSSELPDPPHPNETGSSAATTTQDKSFVLTSPIYAPYGCGFPMSRLLKRSLMLKERLTEVFVHLHRITEQRVGF